MYKLVAIDMDGTLLKDDKTISENNCIAIRNAKARGVKVVIATGRPVDGIENYLKQLNLINEEDYAVCFNGALVQNNMKNRTLSARSMKLDDLKYLYGLSKKLHVNIHVLTPNSCITPKVSKYTEREAYMNNIPLKIVDFNNLDENTEIIKILFADYKEILDKVVNELPPEVYKKYTVVRSEKFFLEFLNKEVNKGSGVEILAEKLGIDSKEIICIGDAGNDIHMIKYAGLGVAMGNAFPEVKNIADYVTCTNEEDGVAHVINKFILNKPDKNEKVS